MFVRFTQKEVRACPTFDLSAPVNAKQQTILTDYRGVVFVTAVAGKNRALVMWSSPATEDTIRQAIEKLGYSVSSVTPVTPTS